MTLEEFNRTSFGCGMQVEYKGQVYPVASVDFPEALIGIMEHDDEDAEPSWKRCENCKLVKAPEPEPKQYEKGVIQYERLSRLSPCIATLNGTKIGEFVVQKAWNDEIGIEESKVYAIYHTGQNPKPLPGSPFESMNKAKAVLEYHFRHLITA